MSNSTTSGGMLAATPATVMGFTVSNTVGVAMLAIIAGLGLVVAASSRWSRRSNDKHLGVEATA